MYTHSITRWIYSPIEFQEVSLRHLPTWMMLFLFLRALRPLRLISLVPSMRRVIWDVFLGWKKFLLGLILLSCFVFMFASLGVQVSTCTYSTV